MPDRFTPPSSARIESLLTAMVDQRIAVVGDVMLDAYITGDVSRISPEAPVPVLKVQSQSYVLGGAGNVAKCLVALGATVKLAGLLGDDADGELFKREAESLGVDPADLVVTSDRPTIRKTRVVARHQQVIRLDQEELHPLPASLEQQLVERATAIAKWADAVILSDYAKGVATPAVCQAVIRAAKGKVILVDPKQLPWDKFSGATHLKPNLSEASLHAGVKLRTSDEIAGVGRTLATQLNIANVIVTRGADGMTLVQKTSEKNASESKSETAPEFKSEPAPESKSETAIKSARESQAPGVFASANTKNPPPFQIDHLPAAPLDVFDVTGAGDVVAAAMTLALAAGAPLPEAAYLANVAAGVKVARFGAASVSNPEILDAVRGRQADCSAKVMTAAQAAAFAQHLQHKGKRVAFTNGCFDILHVGHVRYLEASRQLADALIVGVNADASVQRLKGPGRPVQPQDDRAHILASQSCVDAVVIFGEDTPLELIRAVQPDVLTKGADYQRKEDIVGYDIVEARGGQVHRIPLVAGRSTTNLLKKQQQS